MLTSYPVMGEPPSVTGAVYSTASCPLARPPVTEVIVCTSNNTEGDVTALYISRCLRPLDIAVTRIASGLPVGSDLEFADELTLGRALSNRTAIED